jgi:hypothetical protein
MIASLRYCAALYPFGDTRRRELWARGLRGNRGAFIVLEERFLRDPETAISMIRRSSANID